MPIVTLYVAAADAQAAHEYAQILAAENGTPDDVLGFFQRVKCYSENAYDEDIEDGTEPVIGYIESGDCPQYLIDGFDLVSYVETL